MSSTGGGGSRSNGAEGRGRRPGNRNRQRGPVAGRRNTDGTQASGQSQYTRAAQETARERGLLALEILDLEDSASSSGWNKVREAQADNVRASTRGIKASNAVSQEWNDGKEMGALKTLDQLVDMDEIVMYAIIAQVTLPAREAVKTEGSKGTPADGDATIGSPLSNEDYALACVMALPEAPQNAYMARLMKRRQEHTEHLNEARVAAMSRIIYISTPNSANQIKGHVDYTEAMRAGKLVGPHSLYSIIESIQLDKSGAGCSIGA